LLYRTVPVERNSFVTGPLFANQALLVAYGLIDRGALLRPCYKSLKIHYLAFLMRMEMFQHFREKHFSLAEKSFSVDTVGRWHFQ